MTMERSLLGVQYKFNRPILYGVIGSAIGRAFGQGGFAQASWAALTGASIYGACKDSSGNLYYTNNLADSVIQVTPSGTVTNPWKTLANGAGPQAMTCDGSNIYVANNNGTISKITTSGTLTRSFASITASHSITGACIDSSGNSYFCDFTGSAILKMTSAGTVTTLGTVGSPLLAAVDSSGTVWVSKNSGGFAKITSGGTVTDPFYGITNPRGVMIDNNTGNIYVCSGSGNKVVKLNSSGVVADPFATFPQYTTPVDSFIGPDGFMYVMGTGYFQTLPISISVPGSIYKVDLNSGANAQICEFGPAGGGPAYGRSIMV